MARGGRGNNNEEDPPPPPSMAQVLMAMQENRVRSDRLLEQLVQQAARRNNDCGTLTEFLRSQPPTFADAKEPLDADDWLRALERKFMALHVPVAEQVNFATYLLTGAAGCWWESHVALFAPGHAFTWESFRAAFRAAYIPQAILDLKRREFTELRQGRMDVQAYGRQFNHLSRYAPRDVTNDADKQELFRKGLAPKLRYELMPFKFQTYQELYNQALTMEQGRKELEATKRPAHGDHQSSSGSEGKKRRVFVPYSDVPRAPFMPRTAGYRPPPPRPPTPTLGASGSGYRPQLPAPPGLTCYSCG